MLDKLAGCLKWEQTASGIRTEIPAKSGPAVLFLCMWLAGWSYGGWQILGKGVAPGFDASMV